MKKRTQINIILEKIEATLNLDKDIEATLNSTEEIEPTQHSNG